MQGVTVVDHPLVQHKLTLMRQDRSTKNFRELLNEIGMLICYEITRDLPMTTVDRDPDGPDAGAVHRGKKLVFAPILRAGVGFLDGMMNLGASDGWPYRPLPRSQHAGEHEYYFKAPGRRGRRW